MKSIIIKPETLPQFIRQQVSENNAFSLVEGWCRLYERINPSFKDINDLRDIFYLLFSDKNDSNWIDSIPLK